MKKIILALFSFCALFAADDIRGYWKSIDEDSGKAQCVVAVYPYNNKYYGRIIGTFDDQGKMTESIYAPKDRAPGIVGNPFYCGLDLIWNLRDKGERFKGKIVDPKKGNIYTAELWVEDGNLIVRGELFIFGRSQTWLPAKESDFPKGFKKPDVAKFVPVIPEVN